MSVHALGLAIIVFYLLLMLYLGYRGWKLSRTSSDYLVAGRRLGYGMYIGCLAAVALGGASTVGGAKLGYQYGISGMWMVTMIGLGIMALGVFLTTNLANLRISISETLELRYNEYARLVSAVITAVYAAMIAVIQVIAVGTILSAMLGWKMVAGMLVGGLVVLFYTLIGRSRMRILEGSITTTAPLERESSNEDRCKRNSSANNRGRLDILPRNRTNDGFPERRAAR